MFDSAPQAPESAVGEAFTAESDTSNKSSKRSAAEDQSASEDKRPRHQSQPAPSIITNVAPPARARVGPQYQAVLPPFPTASSSAARREARSDPVEEIKTVDRDHC